MYSSFTGRIMQWMFKGCRGFEVDAECSQEISLNQQQHYYALSSGYVRVHMFVGWGGGREGGRDALLTDKANFSFPVASKILVCQKLPALATCDAMSCLQTQLPSIRCCTTVCLLCDAQQATPSRSMSQQQIGKKTTRAPLEVGYLQRHTPWQSHLGIIYRIIVLGK